MIQRHAAPTSVVRAALLGEDRVAAAARGAALDDQRLARAVHLGDEIDRTLLVAIASAVS